MNRTKPPVYLIRPQVMELGFITQSLSYLQEPPLTETILDGVEESMNIAIGTLAQLESIRQRSELPEFISSTKAMSGSLPIVLPATANSSSSNESQSDQQKPSN